MKVSKQLESRAYYEDGLSFDFKEIHSNYVLGILHKLKINKATGYDDIPPRMVKLCAD